MGCGGSRDFKQNANPTEATSPAGGASNLEPAGQQSDLVETEFVLYQMDEEICELFINRLLVEDSVPSKFFERLWVTQPKEQHIADMFVIVRMSEYFGKTEEFFGILKEECVQEKTKQLSSPDRPDFAKFSKEYEAAEELFEREDLERYTKKGVKLEAISKDTIGNDPISFIKRRCNEAYNMAQGFDAYLKGETSKHLGEFGPEIVVNSKSVNRAQEKALEMKEDPSYQAPVENNLYDLLRAQICLKPIHLSHDKAPHTIKCIRNFIKGLVDKGVFIRVKNKLAYLGELMLNFIYKTQIVEVQIVFATSLMSLKKSHTVYDLDRLKDIEAVHDYLAKKPALRHFTRLFRDLQLNAYGENLKTLGLVPGSFVALHFAAFALANPNEKTFPIYPQNSTKKYHNFSKGAGKMFDNKGNMMMKKAKMSNEDNSVYEGEWKDFMANGHGKMTYPDGSVYEGEWKNDMRCGQGKMTFKNGEIYEGEFAQDKEEGQGKKTFVNGDRYEGQFSQGKMHGFGKFIKKDNTIEVDEWKDDKKLETVKAITGSEFNAAEQSDPNYWSLLAYDLVLKHKYVEAEKAIRVAFLLGDTKPESYGQLGYSMIGQKRYAEAIPHYKKAIAIDSKNTNYYTNLAHAHYMLKDYAECEPLYKELIKREPNNAGYHNSLYCCLYFMNRKKEALKPLQQALALDPTNEVYKQNLKDLLPSI